jgi:hypothetical protein
LLVSGFLDTASAAASSTDLKALLALDHLSVFLVQPDYVGVPRSLVHGLEKRCEGVLFALCFALDL